MVSRRRRQVGSRHRAFSIALISICVIAFSAAGYWWYKSRVESPPLEERVNLLVLGVDYVEGTKAQRSDTIFVASLREQDVRLLAIPRDIHVKFPDGHVEKVNAAYAHGGAELARQVVSNFLGIEIKYYVVVGYTGFEKLVDLVGGVTVKVEKGLKDLQTKPPIDIPAGNHRFDGKMTLSYVRYRDDKTGDLARLQRQRSLLEAFLRQGVRVSSLSELQQLVTAAQQHMETNLAPVSLYRLAQRLRDLRPEHVQIKQVPGESICKPPKEGGCYIEPDPVRTAQLVNKMLWRMDVATADEVRIKVLNGAGTTGLARKIAERLQHKGFGITHIGNADRLDYETSYIIDISGDARKIKLLTESGWRSVKIVRPAEMAATIKGLAAKGVTSDKADVIIILGKDFQLSEGDGSGS